jgi:hypothetical protein
MKSRYEKYPLCGLNNSYHKYVGTLSLYIGHGSMIIFLTVIDEILSFMCV